MPTETHLDLVRRVCRLIDEHADEPLTLAYLGDDDSSLETELAREFHAATRTRDDVGLAAWAGPVRQHLAGQSAQLDLPLDVRATAFQWLVWQHLRTIPRGSTRTYSEIAA